MSMDYTKNTQCLQIVSMLILIQSVKPPRVDKGLQPLMFNPALTTRASERMKTQRFSYFAGFAARERMREAKPVKLKKVAFSHFFDTLDFAIKYVQSVKCDAAPLTKSGISIIINISTT